jgi:anti-sigma-K factor RsiG
LLEPSYVDRLDTRSDDDLRAMKEECAAIETSLSYYRRLAQARIEILDAETTRRARGGSVEELIAELPDILAGGASRTPASQARLAEPDVPLVVIEWDDNRQHLVSDSTLADLPNLDDARLGASRDELQAFERELSDLRHRLHGVLDGIEHEIATRQAAASG